MHIDALIHTFRLLDIVDIIIVAIGIYYLYKLLKDTRAVSLLKGLVMLAIFNLLSHLLNLYVINWILQQSMTVLLFALPVVFQPELRRALEQLGRGRIFQQGTKCKAKKKWIWPLMKVMAAARVMSREHTGALIVF